LDQTLDFAVLLLTGIISVLGVRGEEKYTLQGIVNGNAIGEVFGKWCRNG